MVKKHKHICLWCKKEFMHVSKNVKYCNHKCYGQSKKGIKVEWLNKPEHFEKSRIRMTGENNPLWKGGNSDADRRNSEYKNWRVAIFQRDNFTCQVCGYINGKGIKRKDLNAHHIISWTRMPQLRYLIDNGVTVCIDCHKKIHKMFGSPRTQYENNSSK